MRVKGGEFERSATRVAPACPRAGRNKKVYTCNATHNSKVPKPTRTARTDTSAQARLQAKEFESVSLPHNNRC